MREHTCIWWDRDGLLRVWCTSAPHTHVTTIAFRRRRLSQPARDGLEGLVILISFLRRAQEYSARSLRRAPATPGDKKRS